MRENVIEDVIAIAIETAEIKEEEATVTEAQPEVFDPADHESQLEIKARLRRKKKKQHSPNAARVIFLGKGRFSHEAHTVKCRKAAVPKRPCLHPGVSQQ